MSYFKSYNPEAWGSGIPLRFLNPELAEFSEDAYVLGERFPCGYQTDGGSIPAKLCGFMRRFGKGLPAFLVHDKDFDPPADENGVKRRVVTFEEANRRMYLNLLRCGVGPIRARIAYRSVATAGRIVWNRGTKRGILNVGDKGYDLGRSEAIDTLTKSTPN